MKVFATRRMMTGTRTLPDGTVQEIWRNPGEEMPEAQAWPTQALRANANTNRIVIEPDAPTSSAGLTLDDIAAQIAAHEAELLRLTALLPVKKARAGAAVLPLPEEERPEPVPEAELLPDTDGTVEPEPEPEPSAALPE